MNWKGHWSHYPGGGIQSPPGAINSFRAKRAKEKGDPYLHEQTFWSLTAWDSTLGLVRATLPVWWMKASSEKASTTTKTGAPFINARRDTLADKEMRKTRA